MAEAFLALYRQTTRIASWSICIAAFFFVLAIVCALLGFQQATSFTQVATAFAAVFAGLFAICCAGWLVSAAAGWMTGHTKTASQKS
jgi:hypothetical protein